MAIDALALAETGRARKARNWSVLAAGTTALGAALTAAGVFLPWLSYYAGLYHLSGAGSTNGTRFLILAAAGLVLALLLMLRASTPLRFLVTLLGAGETLFAAHLISQLRTTLSGADAMVVARQGPGLYVIMTGGLVAFLTVALPYGSRRSLVLEGRSRRSAARLASELRVKAHEWWTALDRRRGLQLSLGVVWLLDAALQCQPYMFTRSFSTSTLAGASAGSPHVIAVAVTTAAGIISHHPALWNELFAATQLAVAILILNRRTVKAGLIASVAWGASVWALGESFGAVFVPHTTPVMGSPGAAILYAAIAVLVWPTSGHGAGSVAEKSPLGRRGAKGLFLVLFGLFVLESWPRRGTAADTVGMLRSMRAGEPGWIARIDASAASMFSGHGLVLLSALTAAFALSGLAVLSSGRLRQSALCLVLVLAAALWLLQDFGGLATGSATDVNSAPLIALFALCFWPTQPPLRGKRTARTHPVLLETNRRHLSPPPRSAIAGLNLPHRTPELLEESAFGMCFERDV